MFICFSQHAKWKPKPVISTLVCFVILTSEKSTILDLKCFGGWSGEGANENNVILCAKLHPVKNKNKKKIKNKKGERSHFSSKKHFGKSKPNCRLTLFSIWFLLMALYLRSARGWTRCSRDVRGWVMHSMSGGAARTPHLQQYQGQRQQGVCPGRDTHGNAPAGTLIAQELLMSPVCRMEPLAQRKLQPAAVFFFVSLVYLVCRGGRKRP